jgi:fibronectin type 3 domain-containing protein
MNPARRTTTAVATALVLATAGGLLTAASAASAAAATTCASPVYKRQFFANTTFSGTPKKTDCDAKIDENWGSGAPASGLPKDNFGVRWTLTRDFGSGGPFALPVESRDGIRVYLDGSRKVDLWKNVSATQKKTVNITVPAGKHTLRIDFAAWTGTANVKFAYTPRTSATVDKVKPLVPAGTSLSYGSYKAKFSWSANKEADLAGYRVYRRLKGSAFGSKPLATTAATSYTDSGLPRTGDTYYYEVRAYDRAGNESAGTADKSVTTTDRTAPAAPVGVEDNSAVGPVTKVKLYWNSNSEPDLAGYRVYRSTSKPVARTAANLVSGAALNGGGYSETPPASGDWYYYVVTAVDTHGNESAASGTAGFETYDKIAPSFVPKDLKAVDGDHGVTLTWSWNRDQDADLADFEVYRDGGVIGNAAGFFEDTRIDRSTTHTYWVRALDNDGNRGPASAKITVNHVGDWTPPGAVTGLTATPAENGVKLDWDDSTAKDTDHYRIYRGTYADGGWTYTDVQDSLAYGTVGSHNVDKNLPDGERARYVVVAVDRDGNALAPTSAQASKVDVTELDVRPTEPTPDGVSPIERVAVYPFGSPVSLQWSYDPEQDPHGAATGFHLYRWDPVSATYVRLTDAPLDADRHWYDDSTAKSDTTLYYRVTAVYADGTESAPVGGHALT